MGQNTSVGNHVWMDGEFVPYDQAKIPVLSHSIQYGTGVFEGIRAYETADGKAALFRLREHCERFIDSIHSLGFTPKESAATYETAIIETVRKNALKSAYVRPFAYVDDSIRGLGMPDEVEMHTAIATWPWTNYMGEGQTNGIRTMVSTYRRPDIATALPQSKLSGNYINSVLARREANRHGFNEAILLDLQGFVAEGPGENLFLVKDKKIYTPLPTNILPGFTRSSIIAIAKHLGHELIEKQLTRNNLYTADELLLVGTAVEVAPVIEVDNRKINTGTPGPITRQLAEMYFKCTRGEVAPFREWITLVD